MSKLHFITYKEKFSGVTKDGHQMFIADIVNELNRKSFLENYKLEADAKIAELEKERDALKRFVNFQGELVENADTRIDEKDCKIIELEKENQLLKRVEQIFSDVPDLEFSRFEEMFPDEFEVHNIEQQAKAIKAALNDFMCDEYSTQVYVADLDRRVDELTRRAAKLKEQEL